MGCTRALTGSSQNGAWDRSATSSSAASGASWHHRHAARTRRAVCFLPCRPSMRGRRNRTVSGAIRGLLPRVALLPHVALLPRVALLLRVALLTRVACARSGRPAWNVSSAAERSAAPARTMDAVSWRNAARHPCGLRGGYRAVWDTNAPSDPMPHAICCHWIPRRVGYQRPLGSDAACDLLSLDTEPCGIPMPTAGAHYEQPQNVLAASRRSDCKWERRHRPRCKWERLSPLPLAAAPFQTDDDW